MENIDSWLSEVEFTQEEVEDIERIADELIRQLKYLTDLYGFVDELESWSGAGDSLHRYLINDSKYSRTSARNSLQSVSNRLSEIHNIIRSSGLLSVVQQDFENVDGFDYDWEFVESVLLDINGGKGNNPEADIKEMMRICRDEVDESPFQNESISILDEIEQKGLELFSTLSDEAEDWSDRYTLHLDEGGLIADGGVAIALRLAIILVAVMGGALIVHDIGVKDGPKSIYQGFGMLGMILISLS